MRKCGVRPDSAAPFLDRIDEHLLARAHERPLRRRCRCCWASFRICSRRCFSSARDIVCHAEGGRARPRRVGEHEQAVEADFLHERHRRLEIGLRLARIADDDVARQGEAGDGLAQERHLLEVFARACSLVAFEEDAIRARLDGQVQVGAHLGQLASASAMRVVTCSGCEVVNRSRRRPATASHALEQAREVDVRRAGRRSRSGRGA